MDNIEAAKCLSEGKVVARLDWRRGETLALNEQGKVVDETGCVICKNLKGFDKLWADTTGWKVVSGASGAAVKKVEKPWNPPEVPATVEVTPVAPVAKQEATVPPVALDDASEWEPPKMTEQQLVEEVCKFAEDSVKAILDAAPPAKEPAPVVDDYSWIKPGVRADWLREEVIINDVPALDKDLKWCANVTRADGKFYSAPVDTLEPVNEKTIRFNESDDCYEWIKPGVEATFYGERVKVISRPYFVSGFDDEQVSVLINGTSREVMAYDLVQFTPVEDSFAAEVKAVTDGIAEVLVAKNKAYGDAALNPVRVFSKADPIEQLKVRIDDKISRLARGNDAGEDTELDLIGYLVLLRIAKKRAA